MFIEPYIKTDISEDDEPLLHELDGVKYINKFVKYEGDNADELQLIIDLSKSARVICEKFTNLSFAEKTLVVQFEYEYVKKYNYRISLPYGPHSSITTVWYVDTDNNATEMTLGTDYYKFGYKFLDIWFPSIVSIIDSYIYPDFRVEYVAGYGIEDSTEDLPENIRLAMAKLVSQWYHNRNESVQTLSDEARRLLYPFRKK